MGNAAGRVTASLMMCMLSLAFAAAALWIGGASNGMIEAISTSSAGSTPCWNMGVQGVLQRADAAIRYEFADTTGTERRIFRMVAGHTASVRVYLREMTSKAPILSGRCGLGTAAVTVRFSGTPGVVAVRAAADIHPAVAPHGPWAFGTPRIAGSAISPSASLSDASDLRGGAYPDARGRVFLGTFVISGRAAGTVTMNAEDANPNVQYDTTSFGTDPVTFAPADYDTLISTAAATLTVVPTPRPIRSTVTKNRRDAP
jgi:hypothetical protein